MEDIDPPLGSKLYSVWGCVFVGLGLPKMWAHGISGSGCRSVQSESMKQLELNPSPESEGPFFKSELIFD